MSEAVHIQVKVCTTSDGRVYMAPVCGPGDREVCIRAFEKIQEGVRRKGVWFTEELPEE